MDTPLKNITAFFILFLSIRVGTNNHQVIGIQNLTRDPDPIECQGPQIQLTVYSILTVPFSVRAKSLHDEQVPKIAAQSIA